MSNTPPAVRWPGLQRPPSVVALWVGATFLLAALYTLVFRITALEAWSAATVDAVANVLPLSLLAVAVHSILKTQVMKRRVSIQALSHIGLAACFAMTWYGLVVVMLAIVTGLQSGAFTMRGFSGPALTWQAFQGLVLYATVAGLCYAVRGGREAANVTIVAAPPPFERYLTRSGDEVVPVKVADIVTITGAQDYAEVTTVNGVHLVRMSLGEFERRLDPGKFLRVHRSTIVNFDHLSRAEPAGGGRMLVHMATGESVQVSRAGVQLLKAFIV